MTKENLDRLVLLIDTLAMDLHAIKDCVDAGQASRHYLQEEAALLVRTLERAADLAQPDRH